MRPIVSVGSLLLVGAVAAADVGAGDLLARTPLSFVENRGQLDPEVRFVARAAGRAYFLTDEALVVTTSDGRAIRVSVASARSTRPVGRSPRQARFHYFLGNDPSRWTTGARGWGEVVYEGILPGVDLVYRGDQGRVKYELLVAPGADLSAIRLVYEGVDEVLLRDDGAIDVRAGEETLREERPVVFQRDGATVVPVEASYRVEREGATWRVGFALGAYDASRPLVIDPVLAYSSYHGGNTDDWIFGLTRDAAGNLYVCGETSSTNFPTTAGAPDPAPITVYDGFVSKFDPTGATLLFSTYMGGSGTDDGLVGIQINAGENLCMTGWTNSADFPTANAIQPTYGGGRWDAILVRLSPDGSTILSSSFLGGTADDWGNWMELDAAGNWYLNGTTSSTNFPTANPLQPANGGGWDMFLAKTDTSVSTLVYSTYFGGTGDEFSWPRCVLPDGTGGMIACGYTNSANFPLANARQAASAGGWDAVLMRLDTTGRLVFSTYHGGAGEDVGLSVDFDRAGNILLAGATTSTDFPVGSALQAANAGGRDGFVSRFTPDGASLLSSTYLGGEQDDWCVAARYDRFGNLHATGYTSSTTFPTRFAWQSTLRGGNDGFVTRLDGAISRVLSSTYIGGSGNEYSIYLLPGAAGDTWIAGHTYAADYPTTVAARQPASGGDRDGFLSHLVPSAAELSNEVVLGLDAYPASGGFCDIRRDGAAGNAQDAWIRLDRGLYNSFSGETHPACGDVDGDGYDEIVVGYGTYTPDGGWMAVFEDRAGRYALVRWILLPWRAYDRANGCVWPACGDLDGDGAAEIVAGLGSYPAAGGYAIVFESARKRFAYRKLIRLPWSAYNAANGETRAACGDLDGDGRDEIVVATGTYTAMGGMWAVFEDLASGNAFAGWRRLGFMSYNWADGQLWPACGDVDGDGRDEVLLGIGPYPASGGWVQVRDDAVGGYVSTGWLRVPWTAYNRSIGETRPGSGDIDGDGRAEVIVGLGAYTVSGGFAWVADNAGGGWAGARWIRVPWSAYNSAVGATRPAVGNLGD